MCRIFGFRSVLSSKLHKSLVSADNALSEQSKKHPDGWGVCYYENKVPNVFKSSTGAHKDTIFHRISKAVTSKTVIAHVRKATVGALSVHNCHPFQFGSWTFAHNGNVENFKKVRGKLYERISETLQPFIIGDTDSEVIFYMLLSRLIETKSISAEFSFAELEFAARTTLKDLKEIAGELNDDSSGPPEKNYASFIVSNGSLMLAHQGGQSLHVSIHKKDCPEKDSCQFFKPYCVAPTQIGKVSHFLIASEPLSAENVWRPLTFGEIIGVDGDMNLYQT